MVKRLADKGNAGIYIHVYFSSQLWVFATMEVQLHILEGCNDHKEGEVGWRMGEKATLRECGTSSQGN